MKFNVKTSSKNLGKLMRSGETSAAHPEQKASTKTAKDIRREAKIEEELAQLDTDSFERILRNVADSKTDLLKGIPSGADPALVSIMGLIDDNKERLAAEKEHNNTSSKAPVKFDEVVDFIDDGAEEIDIDKLPEPVTIVKKLNVTSPIRGNPVINLNAINGNGPNKDGDGAYARKMEDMISQMEKGQNQSFYSSNLVNSQLEAITNAVDDCDMELVRKSQTNFLCTEQEQIEHLNNKGLSSTANYNILGPSSAGQFASFFSPKEVIGTDLGAVNPISLQNQHFFQTLTPNGRLLPAVPRKYFNAGAVLAKHQPRPAPIKQPVTIMLQSTGSGLQVNKEAYIPQLGSPTGSFSPPKTPPLQTQSQPQENRALSASTKKKNKKKEKAAKKAAAAIAEEKENAGAAKKGEKPASLEVNTSIEEDKEGEKENQKENEKEIETVEMTEEEREARRLKNRKDRMKKKARKQEEKKLDMKAIDTVVHQIGKEQDESRKDGSPMGGSTSSQEESPKTARQRAANGGKNKKSEKGVVEEYTVPSNGILPISADELNWLLHLYVSDIVAAVNYARLKKLIQEHEGQDRLAEVLKELGIDDINELVECRKKKPKKGKGNNNNNNNDNKNKQQQQKESAEAKKKKMDEASVAASITKREKNSEEDDNQSYVSAQENVEANTRISTPEEFQDARQSRDDSENVMLDPKNYADDRGIEALAQQLADEDAEFVTVSSKKGKKNKKVEAPPAPPAPPAPSTAPSSVTGNQNRRASTAASSVSNQGATHSQQQQRPANRPMPHSSTLGDFMDSTPKKDSHKNTKKKGASGGSGGQKKPHQQVQHDEMPPPSPAFEDALDQPISVNTNNNPPCGVSYADAAKHKKSTSGDSSPSPNAYDTPPQGTNSPAPSTSVKKEVVEKSKTPSPTPPEIVPTTSQPAVPSFASAVTGGVQLPPSAASAVADDEISFGYEETPEDKRKQQQRKKSKNSPQPTPSAPSSSRQNTQPQRINPGDLFKQLGNQKMAAMPIASTSEEAIAMTQTLSKLWDLYQNTGTKPIRYSAGKPLF